MLALLRIVEVLMLHQHLAQRKALLELRGGQLFHTAGRVDGDGDDALLPRFRKQHAHQGARDPQCLCDLVLRHVLLVVHPRAGDETLEFFVGRAHVSLLVAM